MAPGSELALQRRLQPLYEAIDARNYKSAMKLANATLQKHPESLLLKSLKALILERTGKLDEAYELCSEVKQAGTTDEQTLSTMYIVYKSIGKLNEATEAYENAAAKCPESIDLMTCLFSSHVRQYSFVKQQQIAMKLYKKLGDPKYLFWAVCSIQLQVYRGGEGAGRLLSLAEALLKKRIDSSGLQHLESLLLYLSILQQGGKVESAIDVLDGSLGKLFSISLDRLRIQGGLEMRLCKFERAVNIQMEILRSSPDDWAALLLYLDALLEVKGVFPGRPSDAAALNQETNGRVEQEDLPLDEVERRLEGARTFVRELQDLKSDELRRGPFLAEVEIAFRLAHRARREGKADTSSSLGPVGDALLAYFKRYGHMVSFASDVRQYVFAVEGDRKETLSRTLHEECGKETGEERPTKDLVKSLRRNIAVYQVDEELGLLATMSDKEVVGRTQALAELYVSSLPLSADIDPKERGHGEELLLMAANAYCELYRRKRKLGFILAAILTLESGLALRRFNPQYKLMLVNLYLMLGAVTKAWEWYQTLEIKHIQLETLSHHILPSLIGLDCWEEAEAVLNKLSRFHDDHQKEAADLVLTAYKNGIYSKVLEFVEFKDRLENSHQRLSGRVESILLTLKELADNSAAANVVLGSVDKGREPLEWSTPDRLAALTFNEDLATRPWWSKDPDTCLLAGPMEDDRAGTASSGQPESEYQRAAREDRWRKAVRRRCLLPRMVALALSAGASADASGAPTQGEGSLAEELRLLLETYVDLTGLHGSVHSILDSADSDSASGTDKMHCNSDLLTIATFAAAAEFLAVLERGKHVADDETNLPARLRLLEKLVKHTVVKAKAAVFLETTGGHTNGEEEISSASVPAPGPGVKPLSVFVHEDGAWLALCLQAWTKVLQPGSTGKKKKKAVESPLGTHTKEIAAAAQSVAAAYVSAMTGVTTWLEEKARVAPDVDAEALMAEITDAERLVSLSDVADSEPSNSMGPIRGVVNLMAMAAWGELGTTDGEEGGKKAVVEEIVGGHRCLLNSMRQVAVGRAEGIAKLKFSGVGKA